MSWREPNAAGVCLAKVMDVTSGVREAIILAAGNGDRFGGGDSKLTRSVRGVPLLVRALESAAAAGLTSADVVLGYQAERVRAVAERGAPAGFALRFHHNRDWHRENGLSVLAARARFTDRRFALLMGDHLFEPSVLERLLRAPADADESLLAIDRRPAAPEVTAEATRVLLDPHDTGRIAAIGKHLDPFDALDTGLFVCAPPLFAALDSACASGDTTLSGGVLRLARRGLVRGVDMGDGIWRDIDTADDLRTAEDLLRLQPA
jgi:1L-myo-inositol 1-phosphate cytidylyltransferase